MIGMILNGVYGRVADAARLWFWYRFKTHREFESHYTPDKFAKYSWPGDALYWWNEECFTLFFEKMINLGDTKSEATDSVPGG